MLKNKLTYAGIIPDNELTPEQLKHRYEIYESVKRWGDYFSSFYGAKNAEIILNNITTLYSQKKGTPDISIDEAMRLLTFKEVLDIIYRATNNLPAKRREVKPCKN